MAILDLTTTIDGLFFGKVTELWEAEEPSSKMAHWFQKTGRTGWYYRVLEAGSEGVGDSVTLLFRPQPDWSVLRVTAARLSRQVPQTLRL